MNLTDYLWDQKEFSDKTFGNHDRSTGILEHIRRECDEVQEEIQSLQYEEGRELAEWVDIMILAFDGALNAGFTPENICNGLVAKAEVNRSRKWPDKLTTNPYEPVFHVETGELQ